MERISPITSDKLFVSILQDSELHSLYAAQPRLEHMSVKIQKACSEYQALKEKSMDDKHKSEEEHGKTQQKR